MTQHDNLGSIARKVAIAFIVILSIGPFGSSLDLVTPFLHPFPAVVGFRAAGALAHGVWLAAGALGVLAIALLLRRKGLFAVLAVLLFTVAYVAGARMVWYQFTPGSWFAVAALVLAGLAVIRREA